MGVHRISLVENQRKVDGSYMDEKVSSGKKKKRIIFSKELLNLSSL